MQAKTFLFGVTSLLLICCNVPGEERAPSLHPEGAYTRHVKGEFSVADDTLYIYPVNGQKNLFSIERRTGFQRITNAVAGPREWKRQRSFGIWVEEEGLLREQKLGKFYALAEGGKSITTGSSRYRRIHD
ncbi:MAG TPA: hypothetical protein VGN63_18890 [Flavisolibacter sp.]|jgi:hypothetical protein|nr:hypothetical protein [Flavisolibacter sp.]